jgi:hypothetical protein
MVSISFPKIALLGSYYYLLASLVGMLGFYLGVLFLLVGMLVSGL